MKRMLGSCYLEDMLQIEEAGKLPQVNVEQRVKGATKFAQVGQDAALTLLQSATDPHHQLFHILCGLLFVVCSLPPDVLKHVTGGFNVWQLVFLEQSHGLTLLDLRMVWHGAHPRVCTLWILCLWQGILLKVPWAWALPWTHPSSTLRWWNLRHTSGSTRFSPKPWPSSCSMDIWQHHLGTTSVLLTHLQSTWKQSRSHRSWKNLCLWRLGWS